MFMPCALEEHSLHAQEGTELSRQPARNAVTAGAVHIPGGIQASPSKQPGESGANADMHARSWHFDFTHPFAYLAHTITNVPMPGCTKQKPLTLPAKSGTATSKADSSKRAIEVKKETKKGR